MSNIDDLYFCEDCQQNLTPEQYGVHNADHCIKKIEFRRLEDTKIVRHKTTGNRKNIPLSHNEFEQLKKIVEENKLLKNENRIFKERIAEAKVLYDKWKNKDVVNTAEMIIVRMAIALNIYLPPKSQRYPEGCKTCNAAIDGKPDWDRSCCNSCANSED